MRLVWLNLRRFRRFQDARVNLDAPVIALVGPNEAGEVHASRGDCCSGEVG